MSKFFKRGCMSLLNKTPDFMVRSREHIVSFWIIEVEDTNRALLAYNYNNGHWKEGTASWAKVDGDKLFFSHTNSSRDSIVGKWSDDGVSSDKVLEEFRKFVNITIDSIIMQCE